MAKKKKHPEHVNHERWLVSYADFITLLFAFFVVMYAISQADLTKLQQASDSLKNAFGGQPSVVDMGGAGGGATVSPFDRSEREGGRPMNMPVGKTNTRAEDDAELMEMREELEETISLEMGVSEMSDQFQVMYDSRGLVLRLAVKDIFDEGSAEIAKDFLPLLERVGRVIVKSQHLIRLEGHADPTEVKRLPKNFRSTWDLSISRAEAVANYWFSRFQFNPSQVGLSGYGHYRPIKKGTDRLTGASNRRVEIVITNDRVTSMRERDDNDLDQ